MTEARNDAYSTAFIASTEKKEKWLKKTVFFLKKLLFFHFKTFSSIIIFMRFNAFLSHSVTVTFPTKVISIVISNPSPVTLFILFL